jgi:DNA polymerase I-like protein with 3'-5' exonuclease and polymerase domains
MIEAQGLTNILDIERRASMAAGDMRRRGVRVDVDKAERIKQSFVLKRDAAIADIARITGVNVTPWDNVAILQALRVENPALVVDHTPTGKEALRKEFVDALGTPVAKAVAHARHLDKAVTTFIDGLIHRYTYRGRIHAEFHTLRRTDDEGRGYGTISGRMSSSNPNAQQIPARDPEIGPAIRSCFLPEEGEQWAKWDYSGQELRVAVHFAAAAKLPGADAMVQRYLTEPNIDLHGETARLMGVARPAAKAITLGINYGMGGAKLCKQLGLPTRMKEIRGHMMEVAGPEGEELLRKHLEAVPWVKGLYTLAKDTAERRGYVKTLLGRRSRFPRGPDGKYMWTHAAANRVIQGTSADMMKVALARLREAEFPVLLTVHDEVDLSIPRGEEGDRQAKAITEIMQNAIPLVVPTTVDFKAGSDWGAVK